MFILQDLEIDKTILPLFDFTLTERGRQALKMLLSKGLGTLEEILERQEVLKAFHAHWHVLADFNFKVIDCREAFEYCFNLPQDHQEKPKFFDSVFSFKTRKGELPSKRSKLIQLLLLFEHLTTKYFLGLHSSQLPKELRQGVANFLFLYEESGMASYLILLRQDKFSSSHILQLEKRLQQLNQGELKQAWEFLFLFEAYFSLAKGMKKLDLIFPFFEPESFKVENFYHPILKDPVKNSLTLLCEGNVMLLTGPNMSGKSTFFKSLGLCVYLAHIGVGVPASYCALPYFPSIAISLHAKDDLISGYSHFMHELKTVRQVILEAKAGPTFAVFDELYKGTNPEDAHDLLKETLVGLTQYKGSYFLVSSHLISHLDLTVESKGGIQSYYLDCQVQEEIPTFSYRLKPGSSQLKIGRILFDQLGLKELLQQNGASFKC